MNGAGQTGSGPRGFAPVAEVLRGYLEQTGLAESLKRLGALDEWAEAVGPRVAQVTRAVEIRGDTLMVEVLSSAWIAELTMIKGLILERLNSVREGPPIGGVRFRLAETPEAIGTATIGKTRKTRKGFGAKA